MKRLFILIALANISLCASTAYAEGGISSKYQSAVQRGREIAESTISPEIKMQIQEFDARGLRLMASHNEVIKFAQPEYGECQSNLDNYFTVRQILNVPNAPDRVVQSAVSCLRWDSQHSNVIGESQFSFTPLGRLYSFSLEILSEESREEVLETFTNKLEDLPVEYKCTGQVDKECLRWHAEYKGQYATVRLDYNNKKKFKDGNYTYRYLMSITSDYLQDADKEAMRKALEGSGAPKTKTRL